MEEVSKTLSCQAELSQLKDACTGLSRAPDAGLARRFVDSLYYQWLPPIYRVASVDMQAALTEYERAHAYQNGTATQKESVESLWGLCFLRLGTTYRNVAPLLARFADHHTAIHEVARVNPLLPSSMVSAPIVTRMAALNGRLAGATWSAAIKHAINNDSSISGADLVTQIHQPTTSQLHSRASSLQPLQLPHQVKPKATCAN